MRNTLRELLLSAVRLVIDVLTSPSISVVHGMVSLTEGSGVANTLTSDVEKEFIQEYSHEPCRGTCQ